MPFYNKRFQWAVNKELEKQKKGLKINNKKHSKYAGQEW